MSQDAEIKVVSFSACPQNRFQHFIVQRVSLSLPALTTAMASSEIHTMPVSSGTCTGWQLVFQSPVATPAPTSTPTHPAHKSASFSSHPIIPLITSLWYLSQVHGVICRFLRLAIGVLPRMGLSPTARLYFPSLRRPTPCTQRQASLFLAGAGFPPPRMSPHHSSLLRYPLPFSPLYAILPAQLT